MDLIPAACGHANTIRKLLEDAGKFDFVLGIGEHAGMDEVFKVVDEQMGWDPRDDRRFMCAVGSRIANAQYHVNSLGDVIGVLNALESS